MLAPAVLFFILSGGRRAFPETRRLLWPVLLFLLPLLVYAYLPVRTEAGAAIHWGDPDSLGRFLAHVTAATHREGFVLTLTPGASLDRLARTLFLVWDQFGPFLLLGFWGTAVGPRRWSGSLALVILFDLLYTVFLNTASLRVTAFMLPGCVALSILIGVGVADLLTRAASAPQVGAAVRKGMAGACLLIPIVLGAARLDACSQGRNYIAYEYALNMVRTCPLGGTLILEGDNHLFPLVYGRIVEHMAEGMTLYDRHDVVFRMPYLGDDVRVFHGSWPELRSVLESRILRAKLSSGVYYAVFDPGRIPLLEGCAVTHCGLLYRVVDERHPPRLPCDVWRLYASESFHEPMSMDFMSRQLKAHYLFHRGTDLLQAGEEAAGEAFLNRASQIASTGIGTPILDLIERLRAGSAHGK
jgi:hypothetical protein